MAESSRKYHWPCFLDGKDGVDVISLREKLANGDFWWAHGQRTGQCGSPSSTFSCPLTLYKQQFQNLKSLTVQLQGHWFEPEFGLRYHVVSVHVLPNFGFLTPSGDMAVGVLAKITHPGCHWVRERVCAWSPVISWRPSHVAFPTHARDLTWPWPGSNGYWR